MAPPLPSFPSSPPSPQPRRLPWSRTDALQPGALKTERFGYDPLDRLTCTWFPGSKTCGAGLTCACNATIAYDAAGNITHKSDRGDYTYDPAHPHAVLTAGADSYAHDAVGNQIARPDATIEYTAFDLPKRYTLVDASTIDLTYDADQRRLRKTTPTTDTLYIGGRYERVTRLDTGLVEHRFYVRAGGRIVAVAKRTSENPKNETLYLHTDRLGSTDVVSNDAGAEVERRSYDAFGARRNPHWTEPPPASFSAATILGFTGEEDDELGLVNLNARIYDPKLGRFLQVDPLIGEPSSGQSWNPYSFALNNPLRMTDRTGLAPEDEASGGAPSGGGATGTEPGPQDPQIAYDRNCKAYDWKLYRAVKGAEGQTANLVEGNQINLTANEVTVEGRPLLFNPEEPWGSKDPLIKLRTAGDVWFYNLIKLWCASQIAGGTVVAVLQSGGALPTAQVFLATLVVGLATGAPNEQAVPGVVVDTIDKTVLRGQRENAAEGLFGGPRAVIDPGSSTPTPLPDPGATSGGSGSNGRAGAQERLRQIARDPNTSSADRGWIEQESNSIERGKRTTIRNPPGKQLAHTRGREAAKGYDHVESPSNLQDTDLHRAQHRFDDFGRKNKERP